MLAHALLQYLRDTGSGESGRIFSISLTGSNLQRLHLEELWKIGAQSQSSTEQVGEGAPRQADTAGNELAGSISAKPIASTSSLYFMPLAKSVSRVHTVPMPAATKTVLPADSLLVIEHALISSGDNLLGLHVGSATCSSSSSSSNLAQKSAASVLSQFSRFNLQAGSQTFLEWAPVSGTLCSIRGLQPCSPAKAARRSQMLQAMLREGATPEGDTPQAHRKFIWDDLDAEIAGELCAADALEEAAGKFDYCLTSSGLERLAFGVQVCNPLPVVSPRMHVPVGELSTLHALQRLLHAGWLWDMLPNKRQLHAAPYVRGGPMIFYSAGVEIELPYLRALLRAEELFDEGLPSLPHGLAAEEYEGALAGKHLPQCRNPVLQDAQDTEALPAQAAITDREPECPGLELDGYGWFIPAAETKRKHATGVLASTRTQKLMPPASIHQATKEKPRYFERQVGAMCGLHALNNALSCRTGRQIFDSHSIADAMQTLQQEHVRDQVPWSPRDHASPSGDYSLQLLQWMLLRRQVSSPGVEFYTCSNLADVRHTTEDQFNAADLAGGLVHEPYGNDLEGGHWVAFTRAKYAGTFFWMDSTSGLACEQSWRI